ncbi:phage terminase large subunit family protein [Hahella ganghwensis]|uniref:phage terminase large subunit family protein n=1 Tax=Hahella ganghwensis TaxID=286420 RepID=UPI000524288E|nr:terminase gpA endonuclease subunit [Hahella ganghwensis]
MYGSATAIRQDVTALVRAPERVTVYEAATKYLKVQYPDGTWREYDCSLAPEMKEVMECMSSREYEAVVLAGPARSSKTVTVDGFLAYGIKCDPSDMLVVHTSQDLGRKYSKERVDRFIRHSPELKSRLSTRANDDNTFDKVFKAGNILSIGWPSIKQISSRDLKFCAATDYDRRETDNVDGEGDLFTLLKKRNTTFRSAGMTFIESSPGFEILDPSWNPNPDRPHEAPPCKGIMGIYNRGDRRRIYWQCLGCQEWFQPTMELYNTVDQGDPAATAKTVKLGCPHCGHLHDYSDRPTLKDNQRWLKEGQSLTKDGEVVGKGRESTIASFWFEGPVAAYQTWVSQITALLQAEEEYERTGDEEALKSTINVDQGRPYLSRSRQNDRDASVFDDRKEHWEKGVVPEGVRFLIASVDVQAGSKLKNKKKRFVVQVHGFGEHLECSLIDRFNIKWSDRKNDKGDFEPINPAQYLEDWDQLIDGVIKKVYPLADGSGYMPIKMTACDMGGEDGVSDNAYKFYRQIRKDGLHRRFMLVKGASQVNAKLFSESFPDNTKRKDRKASSKGDVPIYILNTHQFKDAVNNNIWRDEPGPNYCHFPDWLGSWFFDELTYEVRMPDGKWEKPGRGDNEAFDLFVYAYGAMRHEKVKAHKIDWDSPPPWARSWEENPDIVRSLEKVEEVKPKARPTRKRQTRYRYR